MKRFIVGTMAILALVALASCATQGSGQTDPILSMFVPKTLQDNATILQGNATQACNAAAAQEYNLNMVICANPTAFVAQIPGQPFVTPAQIAAAITGVCATNGYSGMPATVAVGNCTFGTPTPTATPAAKH